jgi:8-oxo-dGTP diphosphatase
MYRQLPSVTVDAIVIRKDSNHQHEILLVERGHEPFKNHLAFPGGFVNYNEDPKDAVLRELNEETMLIGKDVRLITVHGHPKRVSLL